MVALEERIQVKEIINRLKDVNYNELAGKLLEIFKDRDIALIYDDVDTIRAYLDDYMINFDNAQIADKGLLSRGIKINDTLFLNTFVDVCIDNFTVDGIIKEDFDGEYKVFVQEFVIRE